MANTKDQAEVRERVLKVFKAMTSTPHGGPAIVVGRKTPTISKSVGVKTATETFHKYKIYDSDDVMISDGNHTPEKQPSKLAAEAKRCAKAKGADDEGTKHAHHQRTARSKAHQQREKRRKSRAERNKTYQKQVDPHEKAEFRKHVKKAREICSHSCIDRALNKETRPFSVITQSRLTRPLGIFNNGKKSDKIFRGPIRVSENVKAAVEKTLKDIVSKSPTSSLQCAPSYESLWPDRGGTPVFSPERSRGPTPSMRPETRSRGSISRDGPVDSLGPEFPKELSLGDIAKELMEHLDIKSMFPDRDYFQEVRENLQKMMKSNNTGGDLSHTPSHATSEIDKVLLRNEERKKCGAEIVTRPNLHELDQPDIPHSHQEGLPHPVPRPEPRPVSHSGDGGLAPSSSRRRDQRPQSGPRPVPHPEPHPVPRPLLYPGEAAYCRQSYVTHPGPHPESHPNPYPEPHPDKAAYCHHQHYGPCPEPRPFHPANSQSQESEGLDLRQLQPEQDMVLHVNHHSASVLTNGVMYESDAHKRALESITFDGLELLRRTEGPRSPRRQVAGGYDASHHNQDGSYHGYHHEDAQVHHVRTSSPDFLDLINVSHCQTLVTAHDHRPSTSTALLPSAGTCHPEGIDPLPYDPTHCGHLTDHMTTGQHYHPGDGRWLIREGSGVNGRDQLTLSASEREMLQRQWSGRLKRGRDSESDSPFWLPTFVSPLQKPAMESPSPPKLYRHRMF